MKLLRELCLYLSFVGLFASTALFYPHQSGKELDLLGFFVSDAYFEFPMNFGITFLIVGFLSLNLRLALLSGLFSLFLDVDHIPLILGLTDVGRPAHSIFFIVIVSLTLGYVFRKWDKFNYPLSAIVCTAFFAHLAIDNYVLGLIPIFMPFSSWMIGIEWFSFVFILLAVLFVLSIRWHQ